MTVEQIKRFLTTKDGIIVRPSTLSINNRKKSAYDQPYHATEPKAATRPALEKIIPKFKKCNRCGQTLPNSQFNRSGTSLDGLVYYCHSCMEANKKKRMQVKHT